MTTAHVVVLLLTIPAILGGWWIQSRKYRRHQ
jgi:hypothetical protein